MPKKRLGAATFKTDRNFDLITQQTAGRCFSYDLDYKGENIARMHACKERQVSDDRTEAWDTLQIVGLRVNPEWQRKGVSTWLTQQVAWRAEDDGRNLQSDFLITHMREPFWKKQLEKGRIEAVVTDREGRKSYILKKPVPESLDGLPRKGRIPLATVKRALRALPPGRKACGITLTSLRKGMEIEREHQDVTRGGVLKTAKIAAAHLCESPRYYDALQKMERRLKRKK